MTPIFIRKRAAIQIKTQIEYFQSHTPHVSEPFGQDVREMLSLLQTFPLIGRIGDVENTREIISPKYKYILVYCGNEERIDVLRIFFRGQNR